MIEIKPMDESYIHWTCLHGGPADPHTNQPGAGTDWVHAPDLPPHPWSDETIVELAEKYPGLNEGGAGDPTVEFMREMIQRYGTCAILAWEKGTVVGQLRFYPLTIAQLLVRADPEKQRITRDAGARIFGPDPGTLWVQCVMTTHIGRQAIMRKERIVSLDQPGARKGTGSKLVHGLISWAREHGWKRIVKQAHADLNCMYGASGAGGRTFWEKAGFRVVGSHLDDKPHGDEWKDIVESERKAKSMSEEEAWTLYHMAYDL